MDLIKINKWDIINLIDILEKAYNCPKEHIDKECALNEILTEYEKVRDVLIK